MNHSILNILISLFVTIINIVNPDAQNIQLEPITADNARQLALLTGLAVGHVSTGLPDFDTAAVNPTGTRIALSYSTFRLRPDRRALPSQQALWDISDLQNARELTSLVFLQGETAPVPDWAFNSNGSVLISAGRGGLIGLWNGFTGESLGFIDADTEEVMQITLHPNDNILASMGYHLNQAGQYEVDSVIKLWDIQTREMVSTLSATPYGTILFSPDGEMLAVGRQDVVELWDWNNGTVLFEIAQSGVLDIAFSPDGKLLATASMDNDVQLWNLETWEPLMLNLVVNPQMSQYSQGIGVAFSPDGKLIAAGETYPGGALRIWDVSNGESVAQLNIAFAGRAEETMEVVGFNPDGSLVVAVGNRGVYLFGIDTSLSDLPDCTATVTADLSVNVRNGPGANYPVMVTVRSDVALPVIGQRGTWYRIRYSGNEGWIAGELLSTSGDDCAHLPSD